MFRLEFIIALDIEISLHAESREEEADLRPAPEMIQKINDLMF